MHTVPSFRSTSSDRVALARGRSSQPAPGARRISSDLVTVAQRTPSDLVTVARDRSSHPVPAARAVPGPRGRARLRSARGQGTVEYVALVLLVAGVLAGVVVAGKGLKGDVLAKKVVSQIENAIGKVEGVGTK